MMTVLITGARPVGAPVFHLEQEAGRSPGLGDVVLRSGVQATNTKGR